MTLLSHSTTAALKKSLSSKDLNSWKSLEGRLERLETQLKAGHTSLAFSFIEGTLVSIFTMKKIWLIFILLADSL